MMFTFSPLSVCSPPGLSADTVNTHTHCCLRAEWFTQHSQLDATRLHAGCTHQACSWVHHMTRTQKVYFCTCLWSLLLSNCICEHVVATWEPGKHIVNTALTYIIDLEVDMMTLSANICNMQINISVYLESPLLVCGLYQLLRKISGSSEARCSTS